MAIKNLKKLSEIISRETSGWLYGLLMGEGDLKNVPMIKKTDPNE